VIIQVRVKTMSSRSYVDFSNGSYIIYLKSSPQNFKANFELIDLLSSYFHTSKSSVKIVKGLKSSKKLVEIVEYET
jgi:uncharacterized protein YggU (UPF0235/DUF167 family)